MRKLNRILILLLLLSAIRYPLNATFAAVPHLINYQGRLTDASGAPLSGTHKIIFRIYDAPAAGNLLWQGTYDNIPITKGIFGVLLGNVNDGDYNFVNLAFDKPYWLEIQVDTDEPMALRQQITSAGYAITAENGVPKGVVVMWSGTIASIPNGWVLCDGTNGTPDLRDKFIIGARQDESGTAKTNISGSLTKSGGSATKNLAHTHNVPAYSDTGWGSGGCGRTGRLAAAMGGGDEAAPEVANDRPTGSSGNATQDVLNPYYALAYIMKL